LRESTIQREHDMDELTNNVTAFGELGLSPPLLQALESLGYEEPTPIQQQAVPALLAGRDLLGQAATGTGKTAAFALPLLQRITAARRADERSRQQVRGLVLVPTRELAMQVAEAVHRYGRGLDVHVLAIYGGQAMQQQLRALRRGVDVVVATPGRALDHIRRRTLELGNVQVVVLDEADEMLDMGFAEDLEAILAAVPAERQTALFSATIPRRIATLAERHLTDPYRVAIESERAAPGEIPRVRQVVYMVHRRDKIPALSRVLDMENPTSAIVFCRTRTEVDELTEKLAAHGYGAEALHGGMSQEQRSRVMKRFREGTSDLLIATDVAARGLDIEHVSHVVNFDVPPAPDGYVHRIGRTGRAGREGTAITLAEPRERRLLKNIEQLTGHAMHVETVPTAIDLHAKRVALTSAAIREALLRREFDQYTVIVESLGDEFDLMDVAAAAVQVAHEATKRDGDGSDIVAAERSGDRDGPQRAPKTREGGARRGTTRERGGDGKKPRSGGRARGELDVTRVYIGIGRNAGLRPADLVGAIANESGIDARSIGAIELTDRYSLVEVPNDSADEVIAALRGATLRGKRVPVRRERDDKPARRRRER
jgi:ATP-dependent RNA helicase DeaD